MWTICMHAYGATRRDLHALRSVDHIALFPTTMLDTSLMGRYVSRKYNQDLIRFRFQGVPLDFYGSGEESI
jgi:hypothetical protein